MRLNGIVGAEIPYYKMMNKAMPGPAKDTKRKPKNRKDTYRNMPRENRRRKTERRVSVETINTR